MNADLLTFLEENGTAIAVADAVDNFSPWKILVVDDEPDIHAMTRFVLRGLRYQGRPLVLNEATSAGEACRILANDGEVAAMLVDVVMESESAGLELVSHVRDTLGHANTRIILRTGQPGSAPERDVIFGYDINDYHSKAELSSERLLTSVITALRAYDSLANLEQARQAERAALATAEKEHAEMLRLEQRKADERKVELLAISQVLEGHVSPKLLEMTDLAGAAWSSLHMPATVCDCERTLQPCRAAISGLRQEILSIEALIGELRETLECVP